MASIQYTIICFWWYSNKLRLLVLKTSATPTKYNIYNAIKWCKSVQNHGDVIKWKHFPRYWPFVRGIHRSPWDPRKKDQWRGTLMFSLIWTNGCANNRDAGDLRRHRAHYDVTVIILKGQKRSGRAMGHLVWVACERTTTRHRECGVLLEYYRLCIHLMWWRHRTKTLSALLALYERKPPVIVLILITEVQ